MTTKLIEIRTGMQQERLARSKKLHTVTITNLPGKQAYELLDWMQVANWTDNLDAKIKIRRKT